MAPTTVSVSSKATFHNATETKSGSKSKTTKQVAKTKKFDYIFDLAPEDAVDKPEATGYLQFLRKLLETHNMAFVLTRKARFSFKYTHKDQKTALDVEKKEEYEALVQEIVEENLQQIQVMWDTKEVKQNCKVKQRNKDSNDSGDDSDSSGLAEAVQGKLTQLESSLAHFRVLLEAEHRVEDEEGLYKYVTSDGEEIVLVPALMLEWAHAMYDGQATGKIPPKIVAFCPDLRRAWLHPNRQVATSDAAISTDAVGQLTTQIISSVFHGVGPWMSSALSAQPTTPT